MSEYLAIHLYPLPDNLQADINVSHLKTEILVHLS